MITSIDQPIPPASRRLILAEIALVFLVFFIQGSWPVPDVNEAHYLAKTIHYWNPEWVGEDFFLDSNDTHLVFYVTFGWLSLWLPPVALAWTGRVLTWGLMAWAWRRLSFAILPRQWWSILTAALMVFLVDYFPMAGEWIIGGVEAKGFAFVLVLLGIEAIVRNRWNRAWLLFGAAAMFHVLVGGWAVVAAALAWMLLGKSRPRFWTMWPGLIGGLLLSLPSLIPSIRLTWGVAPEIVDQANQIFVFSRLAHHLNPALFPAHYVLRFALLMLAWVVIRGRTPEDQPGWRMHAFVAGAVGISVAGIVVAYATSGRPDWAASLLRYYWFRLADVAVPIGVAIGGPLLVLQVKHARPALAKWATAAMILVAVGHLGYYAIRRPFPDVPRACGLDPSDFPRWRHACDWIANSGEIPPGGRFLTPRLCRTFKWYTGHSEVVTWKDIPQDAQSIVEWWQRLDEIYATGSFDPWEQWYPSLADEGVVRLREIASRYQADYVLTTAEPRLDLPVLYENGSFIVYRIGDRGPGDREQGLETGDSAEGNSAMSTDN